MLAFGKLSRDLMSHGTGGDYIGLEFSGQVSVPLICGSLVLVLVSWHSLLKRSATSASSIAREEGAPSAVLLLLRE